MQIEVQPHAEQRCTLLQGVRCGGLQIVAERNQGIVAAGSRQRRFAELHLADAGVGELTEDEHLLGVDLVFDDPEEPETIQGIVEPLDDGGAFDVIEEIPKGTLALLDLGRGKRAFEQFSIHDRPPCCG